jgi:hypothetical protein
MSRSEAQQDVEPLLGDGYLIATAIDQVVVAQVDTASICHGRFNALVLTHCSKDHRGEERRDTYDLELVLDAPELVLEKSK